MIINAEGSILVCLYILNLDDISADSMVKALVVNPHLIGLLDNDVIFLVAGRHRLQLPPSHQHHDNNNRNN